MFKENTGKKNIFFKKILSRVFVGSLILPGYLALISVFAVKYLQNEFMVGFIGYHLSPDDVQGLVEFLNIFLVSSLAGGVLGGLYTVLESYVLSRRAQSN